MNILKPSFLEIMIYSNKGLLEFYKKMALQSFVRQFLDYQYTLLTYANTSAKDTGGATRTITAGNPYKVTAPAADAVWGIRVGTSNQAVSISDYNLITPIAHGNGAGQLYHQAVSVGPVNISGSEAWINISRNFNNNSGATITVQEVGLIGTTLTYLFLLARDLTGAIDVLNGKTLAAQYTFTISV